jgi:hypothetical protein
VRGAREPWRKLADRLAPAGDFDRDGVLDLLRTQYPTIAATSGATGRMLWTADIRDAHWARQAVKSQAGWDLNADGVDDWFIYVDNQYLGQPAVSAIQARDGATGKVLWDGVLESEIVIATPLLDCRDLDGDGRPEAVYVAAANYDYRQMNYSPQAHQLWLVVADGADGAVRWRVPLTLDYGNGSRWPAPEQSTFRPVVTGVQRAARVSQPPSLE